MWQAVGASDTHVFSLPPSSFVIIILSAPPAVKERKMLQQITIQTPNPKKLKPLIRSVIENEIYDVEHGIKKTRVKLKAFEKQYDMSTDEFERRFTPNDLGETLDFIEWMGEIKTLRLLEEKRDTLKEAIIA
jgi:hypothetical protein